MKLTQLFSGDTHTEDRRPVENQGRLQSVSAQTAAQIGRQIRSLVPGQTITGEIVSRNGSEVQIKVAEDVILNAKVDRNMNLEVGKNMTFEVKNNGTALTLSPLFTNVSTDVNVLKALNMAGLQVNQTNVQMTEQLMAAGLSVNKNALQQMFREMNSFPQGEISDFIYLHKLQMPVNELTVNQMISYRNLTHQLGEGMDTIMGALPEVFDAMVADGDVDGAVKLYQEIMKLAQEGLGEGQTETPMLPTQGSVASQEGGTLIQFQDNAFLQEEGIGVEGNGVVKPGTAVTSPDGTIPEQPPQSPEGLRPNFSAVDIQRTMVEGMVRSVIPDMTSGETISGNGSDTAAEIPEGAREVPSDNVSGQTMNQRQNEIPDSLRRDLAQEALKLLDSARLPGEQAADLRSQIIRFAQGQTDSGQFFSTVNLLADLCKNDSGSAQELLKLFSGHNFRKLMGTHLKKIWTITPEELETPGKVDELYRRLDRQLKGLAQALEHSGQNNSTAFKATSSLSQNIDFLQQINQMYAYVQLPLRLQQGKAHGELYVYSNKKKLSQKDGTVSALLHLDMEHLGPVDVYVAMQNNKVNTKFYVCDDSMIDFLSGHMDILTKRLQTRGYDCSFAMTVRGLEENEAKGGLDPILEREKGIVLSQYAFDVRT